MKFLPIAGHRLGDEDNNFAAKTEAMEVWMIPLSKAELYVPYYVYIPTPVGSATLTSTASMWKRARQARRALAQ